MSSHPCVRPTNDMNSGADGHTPSLVDFNFTDRHSKEAILCHISFFYYDRIRSVAERPSYFQLLYKSNRNWGLWTMTCTRRWIKFERKPIKNGLASAQCNNYDKRSYTGGEFVYNGFFKITTEEEGGCPNCAWLEGQGRPFWPISSL
jgi:hypothetical protein